MIKEIGYYYNVFPSKITRHNNYYSFKSKEYLYLLVEYERRYGNFKKIQSLVETVIPSDFKFHILVKNVFDSFISKIGDKSMILLRIEKNPRLSINIFDILETEKRSIKLLNKFYSRQSNWGMLWENKVDYLESQMYSFGISKHVLIESFSYYVGIAENALCYFKNVSFEKNISLCLSHWRIYYPNIWINYGNPLSFVMDLPERDEAEYIKSCFFFGQESEAYEELEVLFKIKKMSKTSLEVLFSRLLFPSYYFDIFEKIIFDSCSEELLIKILDKRRGYECFLKNFYEKAMMLHINKIPEWLL